jgi:predicted transcriptional regulator
LTIATDTDTASEELSIAEASLEFGLTERIIREAVRTRRLPSIPHRWGTRVRRADVAELAIERRPKPHSRSAPAPSAVSPSVVGQRRWQPGKVERGEMIARMVGELGEASISRIHQRFIEAGAVDVPYSTVAQAIYHLVAAGRLVAHKQGSRYTYYLPPSGIDAADSPTTVAATRAPLTPPAPPDAQPRSYQMRETTLDVVAQETLTVLRLLARRATLAEIYQAMPSRWAYHEVVRAVRQLVELKLAVRIKQEHHYLYQAAG